MKHRREEIKKEKKKWVRRWKSIDVFKKKFNNNNNNDNNNNNNSNNNDNNNNSNHEIIFSFITENTFMVSCRENINYNKSYLIQY